MRRAKAATLRSGSASRSPTEMEPGRSRRVPIAEGRGEQIACDTRVAVDAARYSEARNIIVGDALLCPAQAGADDTCEVLRLEPAGGEALRERDKVFGSE